MAGLLLPRLREGTIQAGEPVTLEPYAGEPVTVAVVFRDYYEGEHSLKDIYRFLAAPLAERARETKQRQLRECCVARIDIMISGAPLQEAAIIVRPAVPKDAGKLRELRLAAVAAHPEAFAMDAESVATETVAQWAERITRNIATHAGVIRVAADGDRLTGLVGLIRGQRPKTRHGGTIWGVYVDATWRGRTSSWR